MHIFPNIHCVEIRLDLLKRFMVIAFGYIARLKHLNIIYSVELSCATSLAQLQDGILNSENPQTRMDELFPHCYNLMKHVSVTKISVYYC